MTFHKNISLLVLNGFFQDHITSAINLENQWKFGPLIYWSYAEKHKLAKVGFLTEHNNMGIFTKTIVF